ncbi:hypothetical protein C8R47DRAFT_1205417 [Mycena vitilis]|nr:hypothetical protein C8R47DRAFT_1205417 [Mycena vitilis]
MFTAMSSSPQLLAEILARLPMRDLLVSAPLVCKVWRATTLMPRLQRVLFFQPDPSHSAAEPVFNPILSAIFFAIFRRRTGTQMHRRRCNQSSPLGCRANRISTPRSKLATHACSGPVFNPILSAIFFAIFRRRTGTQMHRRRCNQSSPLGCRANRISTPRSKLATHACSGQRGGAVLTDRLELRMGTLYDLVLPLVERVASRRPALFAGAPKM